MTREEALQNLRKLANAATKAGLFPTVLDAALVHVSLVLLETETQATPQSEPAPPDEKESTP